MSNVSLGLLLPLSMVPGWGISHPLVTGYEFFGGFPWVRWVSQPNRDSSAISERVLKKEERCLVLQSCVNSKEELTIL